jgi:hypothetical protein
MHYQRNFIPSLRKSRKPFLGIPVALHQVVGDTDEVTMEKFLSLVKLVMTDGSTLVMTGDLNILQFSAIALIIVFLMARIAKRKYDSFCKSSIVESALTNNFVANRLFASQRIAAQKNCPNCAEQLPLSALLCEGCDYNFLSRMVGSKHKMLPSPASMDS